jgi:hypothetical protein
MQFTRTPRPAHSVLSPFVQLKARRSFAVVRSVQLLRSTVLLFERAQFLDETFYIDLIQTVESVDQTQKKRELRRHWPARAG